MRLSYFPRAAAFALLLLLFCTVANAQKRKVPRRSKPAAASATPKEVGSTAVVIDETLSVMRLRPGLYAETMQRMRRGRKVQILGVAEADGVRYFKVAAPPVGFGWVQADAVFGKFRPDDEARLANLVQASSGFDRIELAASFLELYPASRLRPPILLLFGDLVEEMAAKLSRDASNRLKRAEMAATAAPVHSYYLNFVSLDRYRKLGIRFLFNSSYRTFHYDGETWKELVEKFPTAAETAEAKKRLDTLRSKLERRMASN